VLRVRIALTRCCAAFFFFFFLRSFPRCAFPHNITALFFLNYLFAALQPIIRSPDIGQLDHGHLPNEARSVFFFLRKKKKTATSMPKWFNPYKAKRRLLHCCDVFPKTWLSRFTPPVVTAF
jgi:hypothetical protein